jgi:pyruvate dehydrogenase E2 component (dihydrolipoamide acetyltransferase)
MAFDFQFPDVGEGIHEGKIVKWLVKEGDTVKMDQGLAEIETDKAVVEIPSPKAGKILKISHKEGEVIKVGEVLVSIEVAGGDQAVTSVPAAHEESTGVVGSLEATVAGVLKAPSFESSGAVFGSGAVMTTPSPIIEETPKGKASPRKDWDKETIPPAAAAGVKAAAGPQATAGAQTPAQTAPVAAPAATGGVGIVKAGLKAVKKYDLFGYIDRAKYDGVRKAIGDQMVKSMFTIPHVTHTDLCDVTKLFRLREKEKVKAEKDGIKLTFLPFFIKAVISGLKKHPYLNASLNEQDGEIILKKYFNIGIAVDTEAGLFVPVIKGADKKSILDMAKEITALAQKARDRKLNSMDMKGGSFTITNIGSAGGGWFATPVINHPEAAILGTGMIQDMPVAQVSKSGTAKVVVRKMLPLSLSFDHRILDGAEAARFVMTVKEHLEDPGLLLVEAE